MKCWSFKCWLRRAETRAASDATVARTIAEETKNELSSLKEILEATQLKLNQMETRLDQQDVRSVYFSESCDDKVISPRCSVKINTSDMGKVACNDDTDNSENEREESNANHETEIDHKKEASKFVNRDDVPVLVNHRGKGKLDVGTIAARDHGDGTHDIECCDGDKATHVDHQEIHHLHENPKKLSEGDLVSVNYCGQKTLYNGTIVLVHGDGTFDVDYEDGDREARVAQQLIRLISSSRRTPDNVTNSVALPADNGGLPNPLKTVEV
jgi:hypothetical protein